MILYEDEKMIVYRIHDNIFYLDAPHRLIKNQITRIRGQMKGSKGSISKIVLTHKEAPFKGFDMTIIPISHVIDTKKDKVLAIAETAGRSTL